MAEPSQNKSSCGRVYAFTFECMNESDKRFDQQSTAAVLDTGSRAEYLTKEVATRLDGALTDVRKSGELWWLRPNSKTRVTLEFTETSNGNAVATKIASINIFTTHAEPLRGTRCEEVPSYTGADMIASSRVEMSKLIEEKVIGRTLREVTFKNGNNALRDTDVHIELISGFRKVVKDDMDVGANICTRLREKHAELRKNGELWWLFQDVATFQVLIEYAHKADGLVWPKQIATVEVSTNHAEPLKASQSHIDEKVTAPSSRMMRWLIEDKVIRPTLEDYILNTGSPALSLCADHTQFHVILTGLGSDVVEIDDTDDIWLPVLDM